MKPSVLLQFISNLAMTFDTAKRRRTGRHRVTLEAIARSVQALMSLCKRAGRNLGACSRQNKNRGQHKTTTRTMNARRGCSIIAGQDRADSRSTGSREMDTAFIPTVFPFVVTGMPGAHFYYRFKPRRHWLPQLLLKISFPTVSVTPAKAPAPTARRTHEETTSYPWTQPDLVSSMLCD